ncbi:MAG TPA: hypothetical protein VLV76_05245 [Candidatus Acidoferrum sp.]|nr:hypothetical protein [Candidatus Acidoferrum sp.]
MPLSAEDIVRACEAEWEAHKDDCSGFVKAVAARLQIQLRGLANDIVAEISQPPWLRLADGIQAERAAADGRFVIAGMRGSDQAAPAEHGHVVVVVRGELARDRYPPAYWGRLGGVGSRNKTLNFAWNPQDRDRIVYAAL